MHLVDLEVHRLLARERAADLRRSAQGGAGTRRVRRRVGRKLVSLGTRLTGEARPAPQAGRPGRLAT
jgi:hypothetical protein